MRLPILMYHKVAKLQPGSITPGHYVAPELFAKHARILKRLGYETVQLGRAFGAQKAPKPIVLTFDDGYENFYDNALPVIKDFKLSATVFAVAGLIGGRNEWDCSNGDVEEPLMTLVQMRECLNNGIEFGSHTSTHVNLQTASDEVAREQILESRKILQRELDVAVESFCYPYGGKTARTEELVKEAGYKWACSTVKGVNTETSNPFSLKRINVRRDTRTPILLYKIWRGALLAR